MEAAGNISLDATENLFVAAAANESHDESYRKHAGEKTQRIETSVSQQKAEIIAGGSLEAVAGSDMTLVASDLRSGDEAFFYAGGELSLLAEQNSDYSLYDMQKKGSWGSKKTQRDEVTTVRNVGTTITSGGDLTLVSEGDQLYQRARLESGADLTLASGGAITFEAVKDLDQESHEKSKSSLAWTSGKGKGNTDETLLQSQLIAEGNIAIKAVEGLRIDVKQVNQQTVSQTIDAMVQADPSLEWIKQAELRGDVDWRQVKEIHDSFKYSHSGLGAGAQLIIAIAMAAFVGPAAAGALGTVGGAAATSLATTGAISTINNKGNLGAAFKETFSSDSLKNAAVAGVTAGLTESFYDGFLKTKTNPVTGKVTVDLSTLDGVGRFAGNQVLQSGTSAGLNRALGRDVDFKDALQGALFNTLAAATFNAVGDHSQGKLADGSLEKIAVHALVGGLLSEATGGDFVTGALAAGANEALVEQLSSLVKGDESLLLMMSQLVGVTAAALTEGDMENAAWVTKNATQYNFMGHQELDEFVADAQVCEARGNCDEVRQKFRDISLNGDDALGALCATSPTSCVELYGDLLHDRLSLQERISKLYFDESIPSLLKRDLHIYQMQNMSAIGALTQAGTQLSLENSGVSGNLADLGAAISAAAASGGLVGRGAAKGAKATGTVDDFIPPGMNRPFRPVNPDFPPNKSVVDAMESPNIKNMTACGGTDCSEIASKLFNAAGGKGKVIEVRPKQPGNLTLFENGAKEPGQFYHQVYTDGRYVYDPRLSSNPVPKGDWEQHIKGMNPGGVTISDKLRGL